MAKCKKLLEIFESVDGLFPGIMKDVLRGVADPMTANDPEELKRMVDHNIFILRRKLTSFIDGNPNRSQEVSHFVADSKNFSKEEWEQLKKFEIDLYKFREGLRVKIQKEPFFIDKKEEGCFPKIKTGKTKKRKRDRSNWLQA